jgi:hypothetical protein
MVMLSKKAVLLAKKEFGTIQIRAGENDKLDFSEDGGSELTATITAGNYTPVTLAAEIQTQLIAAGDDNFTCTYSTTTKKITIANSELTSVELLWQSGTNTLTTIGTFVGFAVAADDTGAKTYAADNSIGYAVDPVPTAAANAFEVISDLAITPTGELNSRAPYGNTLSPSRSLMGKRWYEISFIVELRGSGDADVAPSGLGDLLEACGMSETVTEGEVVYAPMSTKDLMASVTLYIYLDGLLHVFSGCKGTVKLLCVVGQTSKLEFKLMSIYAAPTDVAIASPTYDSTVPPVVLSAAFTFDSEAFAIQQLEIDLANVLVAKESLNEATGISGIAIVGREPKGSINPESMLIASYDLYTIWTASTQKEISIVIGSADGNKYTIVMPDVVLESIGYGDRNGIRTNELPFRLTKDSSAGENEISITHNTVVA